jgi:biotin-(acetyl-CoA carboxylase) ligase
MTSLREAAGGRAVDLDLDRLLGGFLAHLEPRLAALRHGEFDGAGWSARQVTTGRSVRLESPGGAETARALGVDASSGALVVADPSAADGHRHVVVGEITHVRLAEQIAAGV